MLVVSFLQGSGHHRVSTFLGRQWVDCFASHPDVLPPRPLLQLQRQGERKMSVYLTGHANHNWAPLCLCRQVLGGFYGGVSGAAGDIPSGDSQDQAGGGGEGRVQGDRRLLNADRQVRGCCV